MPRVTKKLKEIKVGDVWNELQNLKNSLGLGYNIGNIKNLVRINKEGLQAGSGSFANAPATIDREGNAKFKGLTIDEEFTFGEAVNANDAVGFWGEITETTNGTECSDATHIQSNNATTNYDGQDINISDQSGAGIYHDGLIKWTGLPTVPSATGLTILRVRVKIYVFEKASGSDRANPSMYVNTADWTASTVTWNTKPAREAGLIGTLPAYSNANAFVDTGWVTVTEAQYNNIKNYGVTMHDEDGLDYATAAYDDDSTANQKPKMDVEFIYKIQNGKVWKVNATTGTGGGQGANYANSFLGFALEAKSANQVGKIRMKGKLTGLSGLTPYVAYYLSDTDGAIATTAGTNSKIVGRSLSATELQVEYTIT